MLKWPKTHWGYPVEADRTTKRSPRTLRERGVALLMVIIIISMVIMFAADLILTSQVGLELAVKNRDNVKAEYMAKSANNLALFLLSADFGLDLFLASPQSPMKQEMSDGLGDIWALLNGLPIGGGTIELLAATQQSFDLNSVNDGKVIDVLKLFDGEFKMNISDESSKINVNYCAKGRCLEVISMLQALMSCPTERQFLEERNVKPFELAYRIKDYIDEDTKASPESGQADEDDLYLRKVPPYRAKNAPFDSLEELRMVDGWTEDLHTVFAPYLTIYPLQKTGQAKPRINLNTAPKELLGCIFPTAKADCNEKFALKLAARGKDRTSLANSVNDFRNVLQETFCYTGEADSTGQDRSKWFDVKSSVFRVESIGEVGDQTVKITSVIERSVPDPKKKVTESYRTLYWRLM